MREDRGVEDEGRSRLGHVRGGAGKQERDSGKVLGSSRREKESLEMVADCYLAPQIDPFLP